MKILLDLFRNYDRFYTQPPFLGTEKSLDNWLVCLFKIRFGGIQKHNDRNCVNVTTDLTAGHTQQTCPLPDAALKG